MDLRLGVWEEVLADVECDALIVDPPYGARTHRGHDAGVDHALGALATTSRRESLSYSHWTERDIRLFVQHWSERVRGWFCAMSCSDLAPIWREYLEDAGRTTFAPVACVIRAMSVRLSGDGPSSWTVYLNVARPRSREWARWGTLPGAYVTNREPGYIGSKPLSLMSAIVRDYTRRNSLVCDPCAGSGTTALAALMHYRRFVGAEIDADAHAIAMARLGCGVQSEMFA